MTARPVPAPKPMLTPEALEAHLRTRRPAVPVLTLDALDGYLTALLIGPKFIDPQVWLGLLLGERALMAAEDTREHLAVQAMVDHHNRLSETLSRYPCLYRPKLRPHHAGGQDPMFWSLGFLAGVKAAARSWKTVTDPRKPGHILYAPLERVLFGSDPIPDAGVP